MTNRDDTEQPDFAALTAKVYRLCRALLGNEGLAREASQEALARAWQHRLKRRRGVSWWTWAAGFAIRVCREVRRSRSVASFTLDDLVPARSEENDETGVSRNRLAAVYQAIELLPPRQREVVVLRFLLGQTVEGASDALGCPTGTVKSNLHKAVKRLRALLPDLIRNHGL